MLDWEKIRIFCSVVSSGSIVSASNELNLHASTISRHIQQLERQLGFKLFHRHARDLRPTQQGQLLSQTVMTFQDNLHKCLITINDMADKPGGLIRVHAPQVLGSTFLASHLNRFYLTYPKIQVQLILSDRGHAIPWQNIDVMLRLRPSQGMDLIERQLYAYRLRVFASEEYLARNAPPSTLKDLDDHPLIAFGNNVDKPILNVDWLLTAGREYHSPRTPILSVNNFTGIYRAIRSGIGIGLLPPFAVPEKSSLVEILPNSETPAINVYFVYPTSLRGSKRVSVLRDYLIEEFASEHA